LNKKRFVAQTKNILLINLGVGLLMMATGIILTLIGSSAVNNKAVIGLSFIPLALAFSQGIYLVMVHKYPQDIRPLIVSQNDERLIAQRNAAEAGAFKILRWLLYIIFMGYTLIIPSAVFASTGWWIVLILTALSIFLPLIIMKTSPSED